MRAINSIVPVTAASSIDIADLITLSAATTRQAPAAEWPDHDYRSGVLHAWHAILVEHALRYGWVDLLADRSAAAIWLDWTRPMPAQSPSCAGSPVPAVGRAALRASARAARALHWQLAVLAAPRPAQAAALLTHRHHPDRLGIAAHATADSRGQVLDITAASYHLVSSFPLPMGFR